MDVKKFFRRLDKARKAKGQSVEAACAAMKISRPTWYVWAKGETTRIGGALREAAERYIDGDQAKAM